MPSKHPRISCLLNAHEVSVVTSHVLMPYISLTFFTAAGKPVFCDGCKSDEGSPRYVPTDLGQLVADLDTGLPVDTIQLDHHVQRTTLLPSSA